MQERLQCPGGSEHSEQISSGSHGRPSTPHPKPLHSLKRMFEFQKNLAKLTAPHMLHTQSRCAEPLCGWAADGGALLYSRCSCWPSSVRPCRPIDSIVTLPSSTDAKSCVQRPNKSQTMSTQATTAPFFYSQRSFLRSSPAHAWSSHGGRKNSRPNP